MKRSGTLAQRIIGIIFTALGLIFVLIGLGLFAHEQYFKEYAKLTQGIIVGKNFQTENVSDVQLGDLDGATVVQYMLDGEQYVSSVSMESSSWHVGKQIDIYVSNANPYEIRPAGLELHFMSLLFAGLGTSFVLIGCGFLIYCVVVRKRIQRLVKEGRKIEATITGYRVNRNVRVNGRCPIQLQCEYQDLLTEQKVLYRSGNCWEEPQHLQNQQVTIYVDYNYPNKYYVDLDSIQQERDMQVLDYR